VDAVTKLQPDGLFMEIDLVDQFRFIGFSKKTQMGPCNGEIGGYNNFGNGIRLPLNMSLLII